MLFQLLNVTFLVNQCPHKLLFVLECSREQVDSPDVLIIGAAGQWQRKQLFAALNLNRDTAHIYVVLFSQPEHLTLLQRNLELSKRAGICCLALGFSL